MPNGETYSVDNVRLEMSYGQQRCLSRITTDLAGTGNRESLTDQFQLVLNDTTLDRAGIPEYQIQIKAFDIDFASQN